MKKLLIAVFAVVVALSAGQAFAAAYLLEGASGNTNVSLTIGQCATYTVAVDGSTMGSSPLVSGGFLLEQSDGGVAVDNNACQCYDGTLTPAVWDNGVTPVFDPSGFPGGIFVAAANLGAGVVPSANILICDVTLCGQVATGVTPVTVTVGTVPDFDTFVAQDFTVYDSTITDATLTITVLADPCECSIAGPATVNADPINPVTAQYTASGDADCVNTPVYNYTSNCTLGTINPTTGILTVPATTVGESCVITATDTANSDVNTNGAVVCTLPIQILPGVTCSISIALGRECPGEAIDDPAYNRPGRRGLAATCGDIIDFTVCSDCVPFDPTCLVWTVTPNISGSTIQQIDDCCWRMTVGDICEQLDKAVTEVVTVTDTCNNGSSSVEIEIGQIIVDIGETTVQPNTESAALDINLINPNHSVRAITLDIAECDTAYPADNLVCTECVIDPDRALQFTCSAQHRVRSA